jgi:metallo-beta-lactamase family protein
VKLTFAGAADTVTGSRYLFDDEGERLLVDCGLFQGYKTLRLRNWAHPGMEAQGLGAVILTHAHLDHTGYLPALVRAGYRGAVYASPGTCALAQVMLRDSAHLQEEEAAYANRQGFSRHSPAQPLYTVADAERALKLLVPLPFGEPLTLARGFCARLLPAGHLLGAASVVLSRAGRTRVVSGDIGRSDDSLMRAPQSPASADTLLVESTYGNRLHERTDPVQKLAQLIRATAARGGVIVMPAFAVGRAQTLLLAIMRLKRQQQIPDLPVFLDSPMAIEATRIYQTLRDEHRLSAEETAAMVDCATMVTTPEQSKALSQLRMPSVIIAASGMATGGRVLHHLKVFAPQARNLILFAGYQAGGTRGARLLAGERQVKIHGQWVQVHAQVEQLEGFSAHADRDGLIAWMRGIGRAPEQVWVVHGEPAASDALRVRIQEELGWPARVPEHQQTVQVDL